MRVLLAADLFTPYVGGIEVLADRVVPALQQRGIEFRIITGHHYLSLGDEDVLNGARIHRFPFRAALEAGDPFGILGLKRRVQQVVAGFSPDLIHHFSTGPSTFFIDSGRIPTVSSLQQRIQENCRKPESLIYRTLARSDWITACSDDLKREVERLLPEKVGACSAVRNSITLPDVEPAPLPRDVRLLALGRLTDQKGFDIAIKAMPRILERCPDARLRFAGDGPLREPLAALAGELGVRHRVEFLGTIGRERVLEVINESSMLVMPSRWEGLPVAAVEAAGMGRPIVATRVDGIPEIVLDGETGLLIDTESPGQLAAAVGTLIRDRTLADAMGRRGREHARRHFSLAACVDGYERVYRRFESGQQRTQ
jgi:glycogen(starch) synthase